MAGYKQRVTEDLDRWIASDLVAADHREAILASIPEGRRLDAASAMAWVGALMLGVALIAFVAANWDGLPRLARFALVLAVFVAAAGLAAWLAPRGRPRVVDGLLTFAAVAFAAAIGLTGQIFDIAGDPRTASYAAGLVAAGLALAGRSSGAAVVSLLFIATGDDINMFATPDQSWLALAAPAGVFLAIRWRSVALAHASALAVIAVCLWLASWTHARDAGLLGFSLGLALLSAGGRWLTSRGLPFGGVFQGWFAWAMLGFFIAGGYSVSGHGLGMIHRLGWLLVASALIAVGRHDRHALVTATGVVGLLGGVSALLGDLGVNLMTAAALFLAAAVVAGLAGLALRGRTR